MCVCVEEVLQIIKLKIALHMVVENDALSPDVLKVLERRVIHVEHMVAENDV